MMTMFWSQLLYQSPLVGASLIGMVLALAFWRRCPGVCLLALIGFGILGLQALSQSLATAYLYSVHLERAWSAAQYGRIMAVVALIHGLARAIGYVFVLLAVYTGRPAVRVNEPPRI